MCGISGTIVNKQYNSGVKVNPEELSILTQNIKAADFARIEGHLYSEIMAAGVSGITGNPSFYQAAVKAGRRKKYNSDGELVPHPYTEVSDLIM